MVRFPAFQKESCADMSQPHLIIGRSGLVRITCTVLQDPRKHTPGTSAIS
jgi:hypothetical protein